MSIFKKRSRNFESFKKQYNKILGESIKLLGENFDISMISGDYDEEQEGAINSVTKVFTGVMRMSASMMDVYEEVIDDLKTTREEVEKLNEKLKEYEQKDYTVNRKIVESLDQINDKIKDLNKDLDKKTESKK